MDGGATASYAYDADGRRVQKISGGVTTGYLYDTTGHVVTEFNNSWWGPGYIYFNGQLLAEYANSTTYFVQQDDLGSTQIMTDLNGCVVDSLDYLPFGEEYSYSTPCANVDTTHKFTGKERDNESGLDYFGARYNFSQYGRFMSADPFTVTPARVADPQQLNLYAYVRNNPLNHTDPTGMLIDELACMKDMQHCGNDWQKVKSIANSQDDDGNYVHPELHSILSALQSDSRTFVIQNTKLSGDAVGLTTVDEYTEDSKDFTRATLHLDFSKIKRLSEPTNSNLVPGAVAWQGLQKAPIYRIAESFGHEGGHALFAIMNPAEAVTI